LRGKFHDFTLPRRQPSQLLRIEAPSVVRVQPLLFKGEGGIDRGDELRLIERLLQKGSLLRNLMLAMALGAFGGCAMHGGVQVDPRPQGRQHPQHQHVNIPKGHLPPPGKCRVWFPDRPPGQQPPPGECRDLRHRVPPGAVLVEG
jgi:hypothetical protein